MAKRTASAPFDGLVVVDKPPGWTSHDVVGRLRRIIGTRRVGHAGTLDPMATGVLVCGVGRATKLLGHVSGADKTYETTMRLGVATTTDDAQGEVTRVEDAAFLAADSFANVRDAVPVFTGDIAQRPSSVSAIKVDGVRAYKRVRDGEDFELPERVVHVTSFEVSAVRQAETTLGDRQVSVIDVDATITCSTGTYIRALARDLGSRLGVGGHLTMLRRTRVGHFGIDSAVTIPALEANLEWLELDAVCKSLFRNFTPDASGIADFRNGRRFEWPAEVDRAQVLAVFDGSEELLGLAEDRDGKVASLVVWRPAADGQASSGKI